MVAFGRPYISNPDLGERIKNNLPFAPWDKGTFIMAAMRVIPALDR